MEQKTNPRMPVTERLPDAQVSSPQMFIDQRVAVPRHRFRSQFTWIWRNVADRGRQSIGECRNCRAWIIKYRLRLLRSEWTPTRARTAGSLSIYLMGIIYQLLPTILLNASLLRNRGVNENPDEPSGNTILSIRRTPSGWIESIRGLIKSSAQLDVYGVPRSSHKLVSIRCRDSSFAKLSKTIEVVGSINWQLDKTGIVGKGLRKFEVDICLWYA